MHSTEAPSSKPTQEAPAPASSSVVLADATDLAARYDAVRTASSRLCEPLAAEDMVVQSMPDASPAKWHLAHTTWFFEVMVLREARPDLPWFDERFNYLFNSYYNSVGDQFSRPHRGLVTRPTVVETAAYRRHVDDAMHRFLGDASAAELERWAPVIEIGLHHEQQHQELLITDLKHAFSFNPLYPIYRASAERAAGEPAPLRWHAYEEGLQWVGHHGGGFAYDNEGPRHRVFLEAFELASRPVTNGEFLEFIADGGYRRPDLWLSAGWATVQAEGWRMPLYWREEDGVHLHYTLAGSRKVAMDEPVCHVSLFEADAYARWAGARLPSEQEWEIAAAGRPIEGNFADDELFHPRPTVDDGDHAPLDLFGNLWEWTRSSYDPYPGYQPPPGAIGEYNGKFMYNQYVLRGGSCATPRNHIRPTYRNFFPGPSRWQMTGVRLARNARSHR